MRGEVISVLSLERRYHILSRVSAANESSIGKRGSAAGGAGGALSTAHDVTFLN